MLSRLKLCRSPIAWEDEQQAPELPIRSSGWALLHDGAARRSGVDILQHSKMHPYLLPPERLSLAESVKRIRR